MQDFLSILLTVIEKKTITACISIYAVVVFSLFIKYIYNVIFRAKRFKFKNIFIIVLWFIFFFKEKDYLEDIF